MNIAIISTGALPNPSVRGGAVETLIDLLIDYNEKYTKYNITLYSCYDKEAEYVASKYRYCNFKYIHLNKRIQKISRYILYIINKIPNNYMGNIFMNKVIKELINDDTYDAIVVENIYQIGILLKKYNMKNVFLHLHNDYLNNNSKLCKQIFNSYDSILAVSKFINKQVKTISDEDKVITLYNGVDTTKFDKKLYTDDRENIRGLYGIEEKDKVIVFSGRLIAEKGIKELLEAFIMLKSDESIKLMIIGSSVFEGAKKTPFVKKLEKIAEKKKNQIIFTGYIPNKDMPKLYSIADIGVVPSIWEEPFGLTLVEQMAVGLPIIASDSGAMKEIVTDECAISIKRDENFTINLCNSINFLLENDRARKTMGQASRKRAKMFTEKIYCENFFDIVSKKVRGIVNDK